MVICAALAAVGNGPMGTSGRLLLVLAACLAAMAMIQPRADRATFEADEPPVRIFGIRFDGVVVGRLCALMAAVIGGLFVGEIGAVAFVGVVVVVYRLSAGARMLRRRALFEQQLPELLQMVSGSMRSGTSLLQSLDTVALEAPAPLSSEIQRVLHEARVGRHLDDALGDLAERMQSQDFGWVVGAIDIHREVGGDLAEVLDRIADTIRGRNRVRGQIQALSAEGRLSGLVLSLLPPGLFVAMSILNPEYMGELTGRGVGWALLGVAATLLVVGGLWLQRMARFDF
jgi:tight adherence protein B